MPSLKSLKNRITSVKSTQKITKAMKMVAAAKLRRAQEAAEAARPYSERMAAVMASLASKVSVGPESPRLLAGTGKDQVHLLVICSSERGLAGGFNSNIAKLARRTMEELLGQGKTVKLLFVGKKARAPFARTHKELIIDTVDMSHIKNVAFADAKAVAEDVVARFEAGEFDVAHLFFSTFRSALNQEPTRLQIIPAALPAGDAAGTDASVEYEPGEEAILADLLPKNLAVQVFRALLENAASEQGSRMTAMDNATRNAGDMINKLTITYNRTRQAAITKELIEIISGAEAL
ncbi:F0F1 ATP synthase subunit gamma [Sandarakinorhabdus cyanobacteriorum]|uniref:ATP synthase gamma chain n=1 Tax=Sandarakinorhabdus cyanobacteriorum TaxID=1981098 RepID=A0A255YEV0_9SPHN|nr:F0F1 ATP synthase subunit gamma [Sandarakinorhabdus cyanobacteriorum]OYQ27776.1 F0F1 ATP synthase subunit gamma [Sandarakinorhabdus cyanobacteriorum]